MQKQASSRENPSKQLKVIKRDTLDLTKNTQINPNIHIEEDDYYWEIEYLNGKYYRVRREDHDADIDSHLDNEEEELLQ